MVKAKNVTMYITVQNQKPNINYILKIYLSSFNLFCLYEHSKYFLQNIWFIIKGGPSYVKK